jgi:hypothetical protein
MISWPWPMDTEDVFFLFFFARSSISGVGSAPGESRQMNGTRLPWPESIVSWYASWKSSGMEST